MKLMRKSLGYIWVDYKANTEVLNILFVMSLTHKTTFIGHIIYVSFLFQFASI